MTARVAATMFPQKKKAAQRSGLSHFGLSSGNKGTALRLGKQRYVDSDHSQCRSATTGTTFPDAADYRAARNAERLAFTNSMMPGMMDTMMIR
ncbi:MAG: hypothetical protein FD177_1541 [Desulfovibrionaceae bacterium]|nr:MAG: hypothetical protein FD177_1541 [Desulfovibrionaceae bacterium]